MSDSATTSASPPSRTIGEILSIKEQQLAMAKGRAKQTLQEQVDAYRDLTEQYHPDTPFMSLPEQTRVRFSEMGFQSSGGFSGGIGGGFQQNAGRMGALSYLASLAMEYPARAIALAVTVALLYPLEQFVVNRAAYFGNPQTQEAARQAKIQNDAASAPSLSQLLPTATECRLMDSKANGGTGYPYAQIPTDPSELKKPFPCP